MLGLLLCEGVCVLVRVTVTVRVPVITEVFPHFTRAKAARPYLGKNGQVPESNGI